MRIGVKQAQVEEAIAVATERDLTAVRRAVMLLGDLSEVVRLADADRLDEARMRLFHPLGFMLASPVDSVEEAMARFAEEVRAERKGEGGALPAPETRGTSESEAAAAQAGALEEAQLQPVLTQAHVQDKFDGIRCQLHCGDPSQPGRVALFSRSRDDMTHSFPELTEAFAKVTEPLISGWRDSGVEYGSSGDRAKGIAVLLIAEPHRAQACDGRHAPADSGGLHGVRPAVS